MVSQRAHGHVIQPRPGGDTLTITEPLPVRVPETMIVIRTAPLDPTLLARVKAGLERMP